MKNNLVATLIISFIAFVATAQSGHIKGVVVDSDGLKVPFSDIIIKSLNQGTYSDEEGNFVLLNVPTGKQTVTVKYLGYEDTDTDVLVETAKTTAIIVTIKPKALELDHVVINGFNSGQARALNTQKNKENITNIVSTDQIGKFPDANIGDAVKRIPGITMQVDQGEARNIIVRGLAPQLNSVTLNGSRIPSAEGDNRNVQMDLIPADMIQTIEVNKAITPDMDADALGGSVNLITKTTPLGFRLSATAGSGINFITDKRILNGSFLLGNRSKNDKFGWLISASVNDNDFGSDNFEAEWEDSFEYNANNDKDNLVEANVNPYAKVFEIRDYLVQRVRRSFAANFDYNFDQNNSIYFKSMYNWRDDRENRYRLEHEIIDAEDITANDYTIDANGNLTAFPVEAKRQTKGGINNNRNKGTRLEDQRMFNFSLGGEHLIKNLQIDWLAATAKASEERLNERYLEYESAYGITFNNNSENPLFTPSNSANAAYQDFEFKELTEENQYTQEEDVNLLVNFKLPLMLFKPGNNYLKFGAKTRLKSKNRDNDFTEYSPLTTDLDVLGGVPTKNYSDTNFLAGSQYAIGTFATQEYLGNLNLYNTALFEAENLPEEYLTANYNANEYVYAAYLMANQQLSSKLSVLVGLRLEHTNINSQGNTLIFNDEGDYEGTNVVKDRGSYSNLMPGIHFKYDLTKSTIFRFAWTNTLARPNYVDLVPYQEINNEDEEIYLGNSTLEPTTSMNFDAMAEHYFKSVGIVSGGLFYKNIKDFIYTSQYENTDNYDVYQPLNGDGATIFGVEVAFQRKLDFLPGFAKNFNIMLNYTYLTSDANGIKNEDGQERTDLDLPGTSPNMFNGSLAYNAKAFSLRLSANYSDAYIDEIGGRPFEDRYYGQQFFLDFNTNVSLSKHLSLFLDLNNITNQPLRYYQGVKSRTMQKEFYGRRLTFGLKYDLFK